MSHYERIHQKSRLPVIEFKYRRFSPSRQGGAVQKDYLSYTIPLQVGAKEYVAEAPGDIVQVDTLDVRPLPGVELKHFTARDVISRWDVLEAHSRATSRTASAFIDVLLNQRAVMVDGLWWRALPHARHVDAASRVLH